ncbi:hypothetical protein [Photobacterium kishitanii]|nr:hypothetical protein [Photobacterium kishitanii]
MRINKVKVCMLVLVGNLFYSSSASAFSCEFIPTKISPIDNNFFQYDRSLCGPDDEYSGIPLLYKKNNSSGRAQQRFRDWKQDHGYNTSEFWNKWNGDFADHPIFTEYNDSMYYGLGFWLPKKYDHEEVEDIVDAEQWVLNHGVQMSVGFGDPGSDSTHVRLDYRWHTKSSVDDGISLQIHVPFN